MNRWCQIMQNIRYFLFPRSRIIDERTKQLDEEREIFLRQKAHTDQIVLNTNRPDVLRNIVIAMQSDGK